MSALFAATCNTPCGTNMHCTTPDVCACDGGWTGSDCLTGLVASCRVLLLYKLFITEPKQILMSVVPILICVNTHQLVLTQSVLTTARVLNQMK